MEGICFIVGVVVLLGVASSIGGAIRKFLFGPPQEELPSVRPVRRSPQPLREAGALGGVRPFSLYGDARTARGRFDGGYIAFSTERGAPPDVATGLTFESDRLIVLFRQGIRTFVFGPGLLVAIVDHRPSGYRENTSYGMELSDGTQESVVRLPLSFSGWLEVVDMARSQGGEVEIDEGLPERLRESIGIPLLDEGNSGPVRIRPSPVRQAEMGMAGRCISCGAVLADSRACVFCGRPQ